MMAVGSRHPPWVLKACLMLLEMLIVGKKDSPGNAWSLVLAKLSNLNILPNEKTTSK